MNNIDKFIEIMGKVDNMSIENYKERNKLKKVWLDLLKRIVWIPINNEIIKQILEKTKSSSIQISIAGLIRFNNESLSKNLYEKNKWEPIVDAILNNWEVDNNNYKKYEKRRL